MKRIIIHWTAGTHKAGTKDKAHYHLIVEGDGTLQVGDHSVEANRAPIRGDYAAHTLNLNSDSIGIAVAAMHGAKERPLHTGRYPITTPQLKALVREVARLARAYKIPVARETILTHAEVQPTLGVKQKNKWDITWLPGMTAVGDPVAVGDQIRAMIRDHMQPQQVTQPQQTTQPADPAPSGGLGALFAALARAIANIFGGRK